MTLHLVPAKDILGFGANLLLTIQLKKKNHSVVILKTQIPLMEWWPHYGGQIRPFSTLLKKNESGVTISHSRWHISHFIVWFPDSLIFEQRNLRQVKDLRDGEKKGCLKMLKVFLMGKKEGWMTKKMGSEEETGRRGKGRCRVRVCEREGCDFLCHRAPQQTWEE